MDIKATVKDVIASVVGSAACVYTGQPFDTVKVRMQVSHWSSSFECARSTFSNEGVVSLWKVVQLLSGYTIFNYLYSTIGIGTSILRCIIRKCCSFCSEWNT